MFSLVVTIISIALVAALALATLYYGGDAFREGQTQAQASKVKNQAQQLLGAAVLYKANHGHYADTLEDMVPEYLKTLPVAQAAAVASALAADDWTLVAAGEPVFALTTSSSDVCGSINEDAYGARGILTEALVGPQVQCYGPLTTQLTTLASLNTSSLTTVAAAETIPLRLAAAPTDPLSSDWLVSPCPDCLPVEAENPGNLGGLSVSLAPITFSDPYPQAGGSVNLTFTNTGASTLHFTQAPAVATVNFAVYNVWGSSCADPVPAGGSCMLTIDFNPQVTGTVSDSLTFDTDVSTPASIDLSGTSAEHIATGAWSGSAGTTTAVNTHVGTFAVGPYGYMDRQVFLRNAAMDGQLRAGFTLVGDTQHFSIAMVPTHYSAASPGWTVGCGLAGDSLSTTGECQANKASASAPNGYVHLSVYVRYRPLAPGNHSVQLVPATSGNSVLPAPLTLTGTGT